MMANAQPKVKDTCPMCNNHFNDSDTAPRKFGQTAIYIGIADVWVHGGDCRSRWYERQAAERRQTIREDGACATGLISYNPR